jgi:RNA 2',3'-cyclic 3'-phosphodiesterase
VASSGGPREAARPNWRCFVAVPVPDHLRVELAGLVAAWRDEPGAPDLRWTDPGGWHLTLAFLGAIAPDRVPAIGRALRSVGERSGPFNLPTGGVGAFPSARRARVAWYGIGDPRGDLRGLATATHAAIGPLLPELREPSGFRAHLTLGRARDAAGTPLAEWLASHPVPGNRMAVDRVMLYRSHLGRGPARYEVIENVPLGAGAERTNIPKGDERG